MHVFRETLDTSSGLTLSLVLFKNVQNVPQLRKRVMDGSLKCCIIKPCMIVHPFQIVVAANKAVINHKLGTMKTKTLFTEVLYNLSSSKNISQSLLKFGVHDDDKNILVAFIGKENESATLSTLQVIEGEQCPLDEITDFSDEGLIKKTYGIKDSEKNASSLLNSVVTRISTSDIM
ncbi:EKC/KEOPS complex subunit Tprkb-like [Bacillus rossius redtenbacheri]|uniref:EKC/KEOPS complex subunit Tprkb-like n=1 Tax=Bacillus rossius redtenbacheri TaxID=93214 RepID=UPI002FDE1996